jgi:hypothetical protein
LLIAPVVTLGCSVGLSHGPKGVALGFSVTTVLLILPVIFWSTRGTSITVADAFRVIARPFLAVLVAAAVALAAWYFIRFLDNALLRLTAANIILFGVYFLLQWFVLGQKAIYLPLLRDVGIWPFTDRLRKNR